MVVYHCAQISLLDKNYLRRWQFVSGKNSALIFKDDYEHSHRKFFQVPLWIYKRFFQCIGKYVKGIFSPENNFANELWIWFQAGYIWGIRGSHDIFEKTLNTPG